MRELDGALEADKDDVENIISQLDMLFLPCEALFIDENVIVNAEDGITMWKEVKDVFENLKKRIFNGDANTTATIKKAEALLNRMAYAMLEKNECSEFINSTRLATTTSFAKTHIGALQALPNQGPKRRGAQPGIPRITDIASLPEQGIRKSFMGCLRSFQGHFSTLIARLNTIVSFDRDKAIETR